MPARALLTRFDVEDSSAGRLEGLVIIKSPADDGQISDLEVALKSSTSVSRSRTGCSS